MSKFKPHLAAMILVEAAHASDEVVAERYGVTRQSIGNWRKRLEGDEEFFRIFTLKAQAATLAWADTLSEAIVAAEKFLATACTKLDPANPEAAKAVAEAHGKLTDAAIAKRVLDARFSHQDTAPGATARQMGAEGYTGQYGQQQATPRLPPGPVAQVVPS